MTTAFIAWRAPQLRKWYPIGQLTVGEDHLYEFRYTRGALEAQREAGFESLASFPELGVRYASTHLFPLFSNRMLPPSRPDYPEFVQWLSVPEGPNDPLALLARSGGRRLTDTLEVFGKPEPDPAGLLHIHFFLHGLQHFSSESVRRSETLRAGESLLLMHDFQNPHDPNALMLRTAEQVPQDIHCLGFCPRYLVDDVFQLIQAVGKTLHVSVLRVNPPPAPVWFRILCHLQSAWPADYKPFASEAYQPLEAHRRHVAIELKGSVRLSSSIRSESTSVEAGKPQNE